MPGSQAMTEVLWTFNVTRDSDDRGPTDLQCHQGELTWDSSNPTLGVEKGFDRSEMKQEAHLGFFKFDVRCSNEDFNRSEEKRRALLRFFRYNFGRRLRPPWRQTKTVPGFSTNERGVNPPSERSPARTKSIIARLVESFYVLTGVLFCLKNDSIYGLLIES